MSTASEKLATAFQCRANGAPDHAQKVAAAASIREGDHVVVSGCGAAPVEFLSALALRKDLSNVFISHATAWGALPHLSKTSRPAHLHFEAYFLPSLGRALHRNAEVEYLPLTFSHMAAMYDRGELAADVVAVTCSTPDQDGFCSLGPFVSYLPAAIPKARVLIGEMSPAWPRTRGAALIHISKFHHVIMVERSPIVPPSEPEHSDEAHRIAAHVLGLVPDGATIQIGRGAIPNAVAGGLAKRRNLGVHSEMISDWIVDLAKSGALTGTKKVTHPGQIVTSFMDGSAKLYEFADQNPSLLMLPIYEVNDPAVVSAERAFLAINSAVEVDLTGQINAESIQGDLISGSGGLLDFASGAGKSADGKFIIAMSATVKDGAISRIVARLGAGAAVTVPRALAHYVITEFGVANLRGCGLRERAKRLIQIAHPRFRDELECSLREKQVEK